MVMQPRSSFRRRSRRQQAMLLTEMTVALAILALVMLPMAFAFWQETRLVKAGYARAVAMEIVDGEMEALVAGGWRSLAPGGPRAYPVKAFAATNLPPGEFLLTLGEGRAKLEWIPEGRVRGGRVTREAKLK